MSATRALSSPVDHAGSSVPGLRGAGGGFASGVRGGVAVGLRAAKSEGSRPRGRVGGHVRWRFGVEGWGYLTFS